MALFCTRWNYIQNISKVKFIHLPQVHHLSIKCLMNYYLLSHLNHRPYPGMGNLLLFLLFLCQSPFLSFLYCWWSLVYLVNLPDHALLWGQNPPEAHAWGLDVVLISCGLTKCSVTWSAPVALWSGDFNVVPISTSTCILKPWLHSLQIDFICGLL